MVIKELLRNRYVQIVLVLLLGVTIGAAFYPTKSIEERVEKEVSLKYENRIVEINAEHQLQQQQLTEKIANEQESSKEYERQATQEITRLTRENSELRESSKKKRFKLIKPDGTIIEKEYEETNKEEITSVVSEMRREFDEKIASTESKWKKAYRERIVKIQEEKKQEIQSLKEKYRLEIDKIKSDISIKVNEKKLSTMIGYTSDHDLRIGGSYKLWGPLSIGSAVDINTKSVNRESGEVYIGVGFEF